MALPTPLPAQISTGVALPPDTATLLPIETAVEHLQNVTVDDDVAALIANGRVLPAWDGHGPWAVFGPERKLLAVYESFRSGEAKPVVVIATAS